MIVSLHPEVGKPWQARAMTALAEGLAAHGVDFRFCGPAGDVSVWWGAPMFHVEQPYLVLEAGYLNGCSGDYVADRLRYVSAGWNGLHGRADPYPEDCPRDRWIATDTQIEPYVARSGPVLVIGQHPGDRCAPDDRAFTDLSRGLTRRFGSVIFRPHPLIAPSELTLDEVLGRASRCFTWNSTAGIEAVLAGVPTWALDEGSMAWEVTAHAIDEHPTWANRSQWAYNLAYRQWTHDELASGEAWEHLRWRLR